MKRQFQKQTHHDVHGGLLFVGVIGLQNHIINNYPSYIQRFIHLPDHLISEQFHNSLTEGLLRPVPFIPFIYSFESGEGNPLPLKKARFHKFINAQDKQTKIARGNR